MPEVLTQRHNFGRPEMKTFFDWSSQPPTPKATPARKPAEAKGEISDRIEAAFNTASENTGTSFDYLVKTARRESGLNPNAQAKTSSASGLFQFIESTWLETLKTSGPELGLQAVADKITKDSRGRYTIANEEDRAAILALRKDPEIASMMAGALTRRNANYLSDTIGRNPNAGELYIAHFLGAKGAANLIRQASDNPEASAADLFPRQAAANKAIFYEKGRQRSVSEVYAELVRTHGGEDVVTTAGTALAYGESTGAGSDALAAVNRVATAFEAAAPQDAFAALFRNDQSTAPIQPTAAAAFFRGYTVAPALFDVAIAEDSRALSAERRQSEAQDKARAVNRQVPPAASGDDASIAARPGAPLNLGNFLKPS